IAPLFDGSLDIIGDVHGEIGPLRELLHALGYNPRGVHPVGRRLIFVGDLFDRGPDSPAVFTLVRDLMARGLAQCVLGNHELNLIRGASKSGNRWFIDPAHEEQQAGGEFEHCRALPVELRAELLAFLDSVPIALEREDLRVVHAAWRRIDIEALRPDARNTLQFYVDYEAETLSDLTHSGIDAAADAEERRWQHALYDREAVVPLLPALGLSDERYQMGNPLRVVTSGVERVAIEPFWASGKWRMCDRVRWWNHYDQPVPVVIGHYWRKATPVATSEHASSKPDLFAGVLPSDWLGVRNNVFCVDFSIGARYQERKAGLAQFATHLGAMRWPERELWFETGAFR
ncbi:MAG: metallophosphoesterase, partial [Steroidobacteraceae bacterium]